jgi:hypothetical protein
VRHIPKLQERSSLSLSRPIPWVAFACAFAIMGLMLLTPRTASAQASAGITDTSGAVISAAHVTITNDDTAVVNRAVTSSSGTYVLRGLPPGKYTVAVDATGFKRAVQKGVTVEVSTTPTIDFTLTPGAANETVQVTADQIALNTTQPELGSTIEPVVVDALPLEVSGRGRQVDQLQFMAPGTTGNTFSHRVSGGVDFEQEIIYNGIPAPQPETEGYTTNFNPPFDMVQEYRVERSTFSAQFGLGQGALTYQMKSGTNSFHGSAFGINRNSLFDSVGFFNGPAWNKSNIHNKPSPDHENNYGFSVGGPIRIPRVYDGRNKTFGHYSQEWYKQNIENTGSSTVPTALEKTGDFSDFVGIDPVTPHKQIVVPVYDPLTGAPFPGNIIPTARFSALSQSLLQYIPDPDRTGSGTGGLESNKSYVPYPTPTIQHVWGFTVDHNLTATQSLHFAEWRNTYSTSGFDNSPLVAVPNPLNSLKYLPSIGSVWLLNYSNAISPHLVMTAGAGWIGEINNQFNMTKGYTFAGVTNENIPPNITFDGLHTPTSWGTTGAWFQSINRKLGIALVNNWLWTKGRNTFNFGAEFRRAYQDDNEEQTEGGHFAFSHDQTSIHDTTSPEYGTYGSAFASFLLGLPDSTNRSNSQELALRNLDFSPYLQDDIKLSPRLTVNLGIRWDIQRPFTENKNRVVFFDSTKTDPEAGGIAGAANQFGSPAGYNRADIHWGHFGPRLGFAYKLNNKTVVQGGLDVAFLDGGAYEYGTNKVAVSYGNLLTGSFTRGSSLSFTSSNGQWDTNPLPAVNPTPFSAGLGAGNTIHAFDKKKDGFAPYSQQWNLNVQRELPWNTFVTAAFVGNRVIHLPSNNNRIDQMDPKYLSMGSQLSDVFASGQTSLDGVALPYPNFVSDFGGSATVAQALQPYPQYSYIMNNFEASGTTYYQSAQIEVEKRFTNGLSFLAGYTLSHLMDNTSSGFSSFTSGGINKYNQKPEWAVSNANEPQTLKVSGTYELPIGPHKKFLNNHTTGNILGGWQVGWILDYEDGSVNGPGENGTPFPNGFDRPDRNTSVGLSTASYSRVRDQFLGKTKVAQMFNPKAFTVTPSQYVLGTAQRNYSGMTNAPYAFESLNGRKHFYMGEHLQGILQVDYFNAFNRTQFNGPDNNASNGTFGQVTGENSNISNRQGQVQFRLEF